MGQGNLSFGFTNIKEADHPAHLRSLINPFVIGLLESIISRYLDDILNINNVYLDNMVSRIYSSELQLNKANTSDTKAAFLDLHLSISNDIVSTKIYDKRDDFDFKIVYFPFLMVMFLVLHPMESISLNSFVLLEHLAMLLTSTLSINC